ncbi:MAG: hypothetical protein K2V38_22920 [Gemmataceae bacterium]|nr:hypothetical protein [Gemmataceae bacterium]
MTTATRQALERVHDLLHEAGWDAPHRPAHSSDVIAPAIVPVREAFNQFVRDDDLALLRQTLGGGQPIEDAGRDLGLTPEQARARFREALHRLCAFAEVAQAQGLAGAGPI